MKTQPKPTHDQLNLPLLNLAPTGLPVGKDKELALALVELLVRAASSQSAVPLAKNGGANESEVNG